jgi:long-chain acyl-CoA synthetase
MTLIEVLKNTTDKFGDKQAILFENESYTYKMLDGISSKLGWSLMELGINKGDRVAIFGPNCPEYLFAYFGIFKAGAAAIPVNAMLKGREIEYIITDCNPRILFVHVSLLEVLLPVKERLFQCIEKFVVIGGTEAEYGDRFIRFEDLITERVQGTAGPGLGGDDMAMILYTSGTTGSPKGCILRHESLVCSTEFSIKATGHQFSDKVLCCAPMFHIYGFSISIASSIYPGATMIIMDRFDPKKAIEVIKNHKINIFVGVPTMFTYLLKEPEIQSDDFKALRLNVSSGASLPIEVLSEFEKKFDTVIQEVYGITESTGEAAYNPIEKRKPGSIGIPHSGLELKIADERQGIVKTGEVGEIVIRGKSIMKGYWNKEAATREVLSEDGWYRTGDLARMDEDGYLYIVGRSKEMIITGGFNIYPRELEEVLYQHPDIHEAAAIGIPDKIKGELACAFIVLHEGRKMEEEDLRFFCKERLANYKVPRMYRFVKSLPKTGTGKISKKDIQKQYKDIIQI